MSIHFGWLRSALLHLIAVSLVITLCGPPTVFAGEGGAELSGNL